MREIDAGTHHNTAGSSEPWIRVVLRDRAVSQKAARTAQDIPGYENDFSGTALLV